ncbi:uncharacterized protein LOC100837946 [Brachypodium distachyon]|uniref:uncharacterized protein LOC100837946 n=1 Tax=Brachypodium distachyon TaxID=15368 RepID=UPI00052FFC34|nr:uncharacterized protein LOC100837946 [Brachypodium distachyon]|eukprot:XP_024316210.1 uncharacterized protein LOC100837946 [Brachypodium distachyon]
MSSSKLRWPWRTPIRLGRSRDFYVRSVTGCARYVPTDHVFGAYPVLVPVTAPPPRSYSCGSDWGGDLRELIRATSQRQRGEQQAVVLQGKSTAGRLLPSMARVDEDASCDFGGGREEVLVEPEIRRWQRRGDLQGGGWLVARPGGRGRLAAR